MRPWKYLPRCALRIWAPPLPTLPSQEPAKRESERESERARGIYIYIYRERERDREREGEREEERESEKRESEKRGRREKREERRERRQRSGVSVQGVEPRVSGAAPPHSPVPGICGIISGLEFRGFGCWAASLGFRVPSFGVRVRERAFKLAHARASGV